MSATLFDALRIGPHTLKNRVLMGSMHTGLEEGRDLRPMAEYFAERARGGVGLMVESGLLRGYPGQKRS